MFDDDEKHDHVPSLRQVNDSSRSTLCDSQLAPGVHGFVVSGPVGQFEHHHAGSGPAQVAHTHVHGPRANV